MSDSACARWDSPSILGEAKQIAPPPITEPPTLFFSYKQASKPILHLHPTLWLASNPLQSLQPANPLCTSPVTSAPPIHENNPNPPPATPATPHIYHPVSTPPPSTGLSPLSPLIRDRRSPYGTSWLVLGVFPGGFGGAGSIGGAGPGCDYESDRCGRSDRDGVRVDLCWCRLTRSGVIVDREKG